MQTCPLPTLPGSLLLCFSLQPEHSAVLNKVYVENFNILYSDTRANQILCSIAVCASAWVLTSLFQFRQKMWKTFWRMSARGTSRCWWRKWKRDRIKGMYVNQFKSKMLCKCLNHELLWVDRMWNVESAYCNTMPCVMLFLTLLHQLTRPPSKRSGLSFKATTGAQLTSSSGTGVEVEMPLWMSPWHTPWKMTQEQVEQLHEAMQPQWHMTSRWGVLLSSAEPRVWLFCCDALFSSREGICPPSEPGPFPPNCCK